MQYLIESTIYAVVAFSRIFCIDTYKDKSQRVIPKCPKIIHYNWFGPIINKSDRENLVKNLKRTGLGENAATSILWTASRFCDPKTYESNVAFVKELQKQKYNICVRSIDELDLTKEDKEMLQKLWKDTQGFKIEKRVSVQISG